MNATQFGLKVIGETKDNVIAEGTLLACRKMAFSLGMEVDRYEGKTVSTNGGKALTTPADAKDFQFCWFKGSGLIAKYANSYCIVVPKAA